MRLGIAEVLKKADEAPTIDEKTRVFEQQYTGVLKDILWHTFHPDV
jgi:hypothetical protein